MLLSQNPACNSFCNACHYKALDYRDQLARKQRWADEQLAAWKNQLQPIRPAPEEERLAYRSKTWLRSSFENSSLSFGMFRAVQTDGAWTQEFVSWNTCPLHVRPIQEMTERLRETLARHARTLCEQTLFGVWMGSPHVVIVARDQEIEAQLEKLRAIDWSGVLSAPFDRVWFHPTHQIGRKVFQHRRFHPLAGPAASVSEDDPHPILAFRQVAQTLLIEARNLALTSLLAEAPAQVVDLYCGTGELSQLLPASTAWLGIELSLSAAAYASRLRRTGSAMHEAFAGAIEHRLRDPRVLEKIADRYALYLNPPRSGLSPEARDRVIALIREKPPSRIVYLSCSASSLARDLRAFESAGYGVELLQPFDFFPQTEHFETLAVMAR